MERTMNLSYSTLLVLLVGCGGGFNTAGDCEDGYKRADDGNCYPSGLDDDTGTSSGDFDGDGDGDADADADVDADADADADTDADADADGSPPDDGGDADDPPPDGDGDDPPDDPPDVTDGDCTSTVSGLSNIAWASSEQYAMFIAVPSGTACDAVPLSEHPIEMYMGILGPFEPGYDGTFEVTHDIIEEPSVRISYLVPPAGGSGDPTIVDYSSGTLALSEPAMPEGGLFGELTAEGDGSSLSGTINACWCEGLVAEVEMAEEASGGE